VFLKFGRPALEQFLAARTEPGTKREDTSGASDDRPPTP
jgi:hypothetical protein